MKRNSIASAAALAGLCAFLIGIAGPAHGSHRCEDYGLKPVGMYVVGLTLEEFIANPPPGGLSRILEGLGIEQRGQALASLLERINDNPTEPYDVPAALQSIGGFSTAISLQRLVSTDGQFIAQGGEPIANKIVYGKIRDYTFVEKTMSGHLNVDVCTDDRKTGRRELFHWDVEVPNDLFEVKLRNDANPSDPFSLAPFELPAAALDRTNRHSIWHRGLDHKLGAKGVKIEVRHVYYRKLSNAIRQPFERLDAPRFYNSTRDSCIDLFTRGYPPATFGELVGNDYCLGRCAHPAIFNSGE